MIAQVVLSTSISLILGNSPPYSLLSFFAAAFLRDGPFYCLTWAHGRCSITSSGFGIDRKCMLPELFVRISRLCLIACSPWSNRSKIWYLGQEIMFVEPMVGLTLHAIINSLNQASITHESQKLQNENTTYQMKRTARTVRMLSFVWIHVLCGLIINGECCNTSFDWWKVVRWCFVSCSTLRCLRLYNLYT